MYSAPQKVNGYSGDMEEDAGAGREFVRVLGMGMLARWYGRKSSKPDDGEADEEEVLVSAFRECRKQ
jgi:hypothetical protein